MPEIKTNSRVAMEARKNPMVLRIKRRKLLGAFDIYKTNVFYGIDLEDETVNDRIMAWYRKLLDMSNPETVLQAIENVPPEIARYC